MPVASRPLGQYLVGRGVITASQLDWAMDREAAEGRPLAAVLLAERLATRPELEAALETLNGPTPAGTGAAATPPAATTAAAAATTAPLDIDQLLRRVCESHGSDLHVSAGLPPSVRVDGQIRPLSGYPALDVQQVTALLSSVLSDNQDAAFRNELELDTSYTVSGVGRFRVNVFKQRNAMAGVFRVIPFAIPPFADLGLPAAVATLADLPRGLVLVTGPTGSGKSTTLASLIDMVNSSRAGHIVTVEDPIEFLHAHKRSIVNQREVGEDTHSFATALKHVLRQDPDVILVGELRDLETIATALTAAETGHLVFATLHTQSAAQSVDRIIDVFPGHQQAQVRSQLASGLQGVVTQQLIPAASGSGRVVAAEVLMVTPAIRSLIREGKIHQIPSAMQSGGQRGMHTMDQDLARLVRAGAVTLEAAVERCQNVDDFRRLVGP